MVIGGGRLPGDAAYRTAKPNRSGRPIHGFVHALIHSKTPPQWWLSLPT
jgi:hypothetical protein